MFFGDRPPSVAAPCRLMPWYTSTYKALQLSSITSPTSDHHITGEKMTLEAATCRRQPPRPALKFNPPDLLDQRVLSPPENHFSDHLFV